MNADRKRDAADRGTEAAAALSSLEAALRQALFAAVPYDADAFRAYLASRSCLTPLREALADPGFVKHLLQVARDRDYAPAAGPTRSQLLRLLDDAPMAA